MRLTLLMLALLGAAPTARADDWLALQPECAYDARAVDPGRMSILYPRAGLPAVVAQGERLVTRVRVPSGLTPPPGIQQDRALVGWSAELVGDAVLTDRSAAHRYSLRVVDVRPDGPSSLIYRASILIPRWAAPGTYGLRMTAPGGADALAASVRIVLAGETPVLAFVAIPPGEGDAAEPLRALAAALGHVRADVLVAEDEPRLRAAIASAEMPDATPPPAPAVPLLLVPRDPGVLPVVLQRGADAIVLGACESRFVSFDAQVEGVLAQRGLRRRTLGPDAFPEPGRVAIGGDTFAIPADAPVRIERTGDGLSITVAQSHPGAAWITAVVPDDGLTTEVTGALGRTLAWFPATPPGAVTAPPSLAARFAVAPGHRASVTRGGPAELTLALRADPESPETAVPVALHAEPSRAVELIAWQLDEDATAVGHDAHHAYGPIGPHRVHALAIGPDGVGASATTTLDVRTREVGGCDCRVAPRALSGPEFWLVAGVLLLRRRNSRRRRRR